MRRLNEAKAKYLVVGGHAVGLHGHSRATKDLDVWIGEDAVNRDAVIRALGAFGAPESAVCHLASASRDEFVFLGHPPQRIDLLQGIPGVEDFEGSYARRACAPTAETLGLLARKVLSSSRHAESRELARAARRLGRSEVALHPPLTTPGLLDCAQPRKAGDWVAGGLSFVTHGPKASIHDDPRVPPR